MFDREGSSGLFSLLGHNRLTTRLLRISILGPIQASRLQSPFLAETLGGLLEFPGVHLVCKAIIYLAAVSSPALSFGGTHVFVRKPLCLWHKQE